MFFVKSCRKIWWSQIFVVPLQPQMKNERLAIQFDLIGALVQLVRMPACHAGGHEFESRTHRLIICILSHLFGALVQLVRMPACHAGGHEFESRTHRKHFKFESSISIMVR